MGGAELRYFPLSGDASLIHISPTTGFTNAINQYGALVTCYHLLEAVRKRGACKLVTPFTLQSSLSRDPLCANLDLQGHSRETAVISLLYITHNISLLCAIYYT